MPNYSYPDGTLKNLVGATDPAELERLEAGFVAARSLELRDGGGPSRTFDVAHLQALHHHLFQDVYEWAGRMRHERVALSDGTFATMPTMARPDGVDFAIGPHIPRALDELTADLRNADLLRGLDRDQFADQAGSFFGRLNSIHPFRDGNGRAQRAFFSSLAENAGHALAFDVVSRERMTVVSIASHERGDFAPLQRLFREIASPERVQSLREAQDFLSRNSFDWNNVYMATTEPQRAYSGHLVGVQRENFMMRADSDILIGWTEDLPRPIPESGASISFETGLRQENQSRSRDAHSHRRDIDPGPSFGMD